MQPRAVDGPDQERYADPRGPARQPEHGQRVVRGHRVGVRVLEAVGAGTPRSRAAARPRARSCRARCEPMLSPTSSGSPCSSAHARSARGGGAPPGRQHDARRVEGGHQRREQVVLPRLARYVGPLRRSRTSCRRGRRARSGRGRRGAARGCRTSGARSRTSGQLSRAITTGSADADVGVVGDHERAVRAAAYVELAVVGADRGGVGDAGERVLGPRPGPRSRRTRSGGRRPGPGGAPRRTVARHRGPVSGRSGGSPQSGHAVGSPGLRSPSLPSKGTP